VFSQHTGSPTQKRIKIMTTTMAFPKTRPQQASSVYGFQTTSSQAGINLTDIMNTMLPLMIVVMMMGAMSKAMNSVSGTKQPEATESESTSPRAKKATRAG